MADNPFAYISAGNAPLYRAIMRVFVASRARFRFRLTVEDVLAAIPEQSDIEIALAQLCEWGSLEQLSKAADADTLEYLLKPAHVFQLTNQGIALERSLAFFEKPSEPTSDDDSALTALADVRFLIEERKQLFRSREAESARLRRNLVTLRIRFEDLQRQAEALVDQMERSVESHAAAGQLIETAEQFVAELVLTGDVAEETLRDFEAAGWLEFRKWFMGQPGKPSNAELLRERVRSLMPALLTIINAEKDRQIHRIDRSSEFRRLALRFAEAASDAEANRIWRTVFGLSPARHLIIDDETLDDYEMHQLGPNTSWLDAPPLRIQAASRAYLTCIIDRTAEKEKLAAAAHDEALRILNAQARLGTGHRMRLSDLEHLETGEFDLFLEILGEAVSARVFSNEPVEIFSSDGCLRIKLDPTDDGRYAMVSTAEGAFSGPDHWISIEETCAAGVLI
jgi:hypothetical protein